MLCLTASKATPYFIKMYWLVYWLKTRSGLLNILSCSTAATTIIRTLRKSSALYSATFAAAVPISRNSKMQNW